MDDETLGEGIKVSEKSESGREVQLKIGVEEKMN